MHDNFNRSRLSKEIARTHGSPASQQILSHFGKFHRRRQAPPPFLLPRGGMESAPRVQALAANFSRMTGTKSFDLRTH